jgi:hypothetical protein
MKLKKRIEDTSDPGMIITIPTFKIVTGRGLAEGSASSCFPGLL